MHVGSECVSMRAPSFGHAAATDSRPADTCSEDALRVRPLEEGGCRESIPILAENRLVVRHGMMVQQLDATPATGHVHVTRTCLYVAEVVVERFDGSTLSHGKGLCRCRTAYLPVKVTGATAL
jgi:hypothetical protein